MVATAEVVRHRAHADKGVAESPAISIGGATKVVWRVHSAASTACFGEGGPGGGGLCRDITVAA